MSFDPIVSAPLAVQIHLAAALLSMALGPIALYRRRRDAWHKRLGYTWVSAMAVTGLSGFAIPAHILPLVGPFGPIHFFSGWVLWSLYQGVSAARARNIPRHAATMRALYWQAIGIAGLLTLLPGRRLHVVLFGDAPLLSVAAIAIGLVVIFGVPRLIEREKSLGLRNL